MNYSTKAKRGRPKLPPRDHGNDKHRARAEQWAARASQSALGHEMNAPGRLMLAGAFDGLPEAPEALLAALLEYSHAYWRYYGGGPKIGQWERRDKSHDNTWEDKPGEWFERLDQRLRDCGHEQHRAVYQAVVAMHWYPDSDWPWAARVIRGEGDSFKRDMLREGAMALVGR